VQVIIESFTKRWNQYYGHSLVTINLFR